MSWAGPEDIHLSTSLASYLDKKLLVLLRDGRKLLGTLRSFDQFANAVLEGACERVIVGDLYCDIPLGLYVIRGENVVLIGELDLEKDELPPHMTRVSQSEIKRALGLDYFDKGPHNVYGCSVCGSSLEFNIIDLWVVT
ncbi:sm-like protein LSM1B isoform X1 [Diospyros lotus]|uniref:sm-like protein LSM1B isoform X1 n=1 Tax=Diospyros lotus TaxID=55363 RepID=UPI00225B8B02|nr:sm-like protein LSM1B isoform X1 [Diospyros lotus]